jgi:hypothetical protein
MSLKIGQNSSALVIAPSRKRETPPPRVTFRKVMEGGAQVLAAGARVATRIVGGPFLSAAVTAGTPGVGVSPAAVPGVGAGSTANDSPAVGGSAGQDPLSAFTNQSQGMSEDLKLLALQDQIQRNNRQIAMVSNVMKARHDTAKAAISNLRS